MATLDTLVYQFNRSLSFTVKINGVTLSPTNALSDTGVPGVNAIRISKALDNPVPTCELDLSHLATWITRGQSVTVDLGYNNVNQRVFTGFVQDRGRKVAKCTVKCMGTTWTLYRTIQIAQRDVSNLKAQTALEQIFAYVGITNYIIADSQYVMGTSGQQILLERMPASQMAQMIADIDGSRMYELNSGELVVQPIEEIPAPSAFCAYKSTAQADAIILDGSDREDPDYFRDQVIVTGATIDATSTTESSTLTSTATLANTGSFIQPPLPSGTHIQMEYNNHLIDTQAQLDTLSLLLLSRFGRIPRYLTLDIAGDPRIDIGQTIELDFPEMGVADSRWFVHGVSHTVDMTQGYRTQLQLRGGSLLGGTVDLNPIATFIAVAETEVMGSVAQTVVGLDASNSYDPDGTISSYVWTSNQPVTIPIGKQVTIAADTTGWVGDWTITLTVTDNDGNTATSTQTIAYGSAVATIPAIAAALSNTASYTPDGGTTWNDTAGSTCTACDAQIPNGTSTGVACWGFSNGVIKRSSDNGVTLTQVSTTDGTQINRILWDRNNANQVWAATNGGQLWRSQDNGVTWALHKNFGGTYPLNRIGTPVTAGGAVIVLGGRGDQTGTLAQIDYGYTGNFVSVPINGDLATDLVGAASAITVADGAAFSPGELALIFKGGLLAGGVNIFYLDPDTGTWSRATGLDASLSDGRFIVFDVPAKTFHAAFGDRNVWTTTDGVAYTKTSNVFPANVVPHHCMWLGELLGTLAGVYAVALEDTVTPSNGYIGKTVDGFQTEVALRPVSGISTWPASAKGLQLGIGAPTSTTSNPAGGNLAAITSGASPRRSTELTGSSWSSLVGAVVTFANPRLFLMTPTNWFVAPCNPDGHGTDVPAYTKDGGKTWNSIATLSGASWFDIDAGGRIWCLVIVRNSVECFAYYSDDNGDTWTQSFSTGFNTIYEYVLLCHPTDQNKIQLLVGTINTGTHSRIYTTNRGGSWTSQNAPGFPALGQTGVNENIIARWITKGSGTRMIVTGFLSGTNLYISYSDDEGATWSSVQVGGSNDRLRGDKIGSWQLGPKLVLWQDLGVNATPTGGALVSTDGGSTWSLVSLSESLQTFLGDTPTNRTTVFGASYDDLNDVLYVCYNRSASSDGMAKLAPVSGSGSWSDVSNNIGDRSYGSQNIAVVQ